jgi:hypothetical protein
MPSRLKVDEITTSTETGNLVIPSPVGLSVGDTSISQSQFSTNRLRVQNIAPTGSGADVMTIGTNNIIGTPNNINGGLNIGYKKIVTLNGSFAANTWYNTGITRETDTGIFLLNAWVDTYASGGQSFQETYIGWFALPNRFTNSGVADGITIHRAGHAPNAESLQFRTLREAAGSGGRIYLQWLSNFALSLNGEAGRNIQIAIHRYATCLNN